MRTDLERLAGEADEWGALAALYDARTAASTDAEERLWLLRRTLRIAVDAAVPARRTCARRPSRSPAELGFDEEADAALEKILTQTKAWADLAKLLHARADRAPDAAERVRLLFRIAQLEEERVVDAGRRDGHLEEDPRGGAEQRARAAGADPAVGGAPGLGGRRRGPAARSRRTRGRRDRPRDEREALLLRIANIQEVRLDDPDGDVRDVPRGAAGEPARGAGGGGRSSGCWRAATPTGRAIARLTLPFYERTGDAPKLAAANEALLGVADTRGEKVERLEKLRGLYAGPADDPAAAYRAGLALFDIDAADAKNRDALIGFADAAGKTGELAEKLRAVSAETEDQLLRRDLLVIVAELQEKRLGRAQDAEKVYAQILAAEPLHAGRVPGADAPVSRWPAVGASCARCSTPASSPSWTCASASTCWRRSRSWTNRRWATRTTRSPCYEKMLELDAADLRVAPRAGPSLCGARALARSREPAGHARRLRVGGRDRGAGVPAR